MEEELKLKQNLSIEIMRVTTKIIQLISQRVDKFIMYSTVEHPYEHISFLETHLKENESNPQILELLSKELPFGETQKIQLVYETKTIENKDPSQNTYKIKKINYAETDEEKIEGETKVIQELFPRNCVKSFEDKSKIDGMKLKLLENGVKLEADFANAIEQVGSIGMSEIFPVKLAENPLVDSSSIIKDNANVLNSQVFEFIKAKNISEIFIAGIATNNAISMSAMHLTELFPDIKIHIVSDAILGYGEFFENLESVTSSIENIDSICLLYTSPSPRDLSTSRMPSSA